MHHPGEMPGACGYHVTILANSCMFLFGGHNGQSVWWWIWWWVHNCCRCWVFQLRVSLDGLHWLYHKLMLTLCIFLFFYFCLGKSTSEEDICRQPPTSTSNSSMLCLSATVHLYKSLHFLALYFPIHRWPPTLNQICSQGNDQVQQKIFMATCLFFYTSFFLSDGLTSSALHFSNLTHI